MVLENFPFEFLMGKRMDNIGERYRREILMYAQKVRQMTMYICNIFDFQPCKLKQEKLRAKRQMCRIYGPFDRHLCIPSDFICYVLVTILFCPILLVFSDILSSYSNCTISVFHGLHFQDHLPA